MFNKVKGYDQSERPGPHRHMLQHRMIWISEFNWEYI